MANVLGQHYFSELWHNGQRVKFDNRPDGYGLEREGHQAVLTFTLPLAKPQPLAGQTLTLSTFDPTYYVDMHYDNASDVTLPAALSTTCKVKVVTPEPNEKWRLLPSLSIKPTRRRKIWRWEPTLRRR